MSGINRIGRRRFVQLVGWAGAAAVAHGGPSLAEAARKSKVANRPPERTPPHDAASGVSEEARSLAEAVKQRHGQDLSPQDLDAIALDIDGDLRGAQKLREVKLDNSEGPDTTFHA